MVAQRACVEICESEAHVMSSGQGAVKKGRARLAGRAKRALQVAAPWD